MRRLILLFPLAIAAAACTPVQWARQDTPPEQLGQDLGQCRQDAWREAQWRSQLFMNRTVGATTVVNAQGQTIVVPLSPFGDPFGDAYADESRLTALCMRARGYELVRVKPES
ncbi:MAG TPA: hypothetical protein VKE95_02790 [Burkholderiales bacterium]|nr:hypothetical protein [Burkholderiales bacterium]